MRILIANRGEIASRIIRTALRLGHHPVAVFADPDRGAMFVREASEAHRLGPANLADSYLSVERLLDTARESRADAVHPGYGFLSEHAGFARAVVDAGLTWIGPHPGAIEAMGSKIEARRIAEAAGIPVIPGHDSSQDPAALRAAATAIGFPVLVKASAGGGGKGIRIVADATAFDDALAAAREEARRSFGDDRVIVERYVARPRHVEVQVVGDRHGGIVHLGTRECSVQRRYQKLLEEAPAPNLTDATRSGMQAAAVALAARIGYDSVGTVEFVVDDETDDFYFLEMNTRLQVEHPVTELVTGLDLVELQIRAACGEQLRLEEKAPVGHAFEVRINAEDPWAGFAPQVGTITDLAIPPEARWDSGVEEGSVVTPHYDPLLAKLVVSGPDRDTARRRLATALDRLLIGGVPTNTALHRWLVDLPAFVHGRITTRLLDDTPLPSRPDEAAAAAVAAARWAEAWDARPGDGPWHRLAGFRLTPHRARRMVYLVGTQTHDVTVEESSSGDPFTVDVEARRVVVVFRGHTFTFAVLTPAERWTSTALHGLGPADAITAPFPGVVAAIHVTAGDEVEPGQTVAVIEAMKMLHPLVAVGAGRVQAVRVAVGDPIAADETLIEFQEEA